MTTICDGLRQSKLLILPIGGGALMPAMKNFSPRSTRRHAADVLSFVRVRLSAAPGPDYRAMRDYTSPCMLLLGGRPRTLNTLPFSVMSEQDNDNFPEELKIRARIKPAMRAFRESRGWSQQQMAHYLGIPWKNYQSYERMNNNRGVPAAIIVRFCVFTETSIEWIMLGTAAKKSLPRPPKKTA